MLMLSCTDKTDKKFPELTHFQECSENIKKHVLTFMPSSVEICHAQTRQMNEPKHFTEPILAQ
jgi:hypothetical protein